ncbi:DNA alkylation repair protein [Christensenellaceae bacterium OttesenSCG-928-K19]|nr:DNA alkylation repair protein [Christensenellaceae bacterium OttesenSCG-928-K19]
MKQNANEQKAVQMRAYMRDLFPYLGVQTPVRKSICRPYFKEAKKEASVDFDFTDLCWQNEYREFQYIAVDYLALMQKCLTAQDIPKLKEYITTKPWWDTIDALDQVMGNLALADPSINSTLLAWSTDDSIWVRRVAIDHQLGRKEKTDAKLLAQIIKNNFGSEEFFINKAIGWSLREYSKTNPDWVRGFISENREHLAPLSIKEGSKYI